MTIASIVDKPPHALLAHPGTQYSYQLAMQLQRTGRLSSFHTSIALRNGIARALGFTALPRFLVRKIANRRLDSIDSQRLVLHPVPELVSLYRSWREGVLSEANLYERNAKFQAAIPNAAIENSDVVIGFDTSSWILAERCRRAGVPFVLDQSIGHPDSKVAVEKLIRDAFPQWSRDFGARLSEIRKAEQIEHDTADLVVAASSFTVRTLVENGVDADKIRINRYGVDIGCFFPAPPNGNRPFRFIFLGAISARKGVPLLLEAWRRLAPRSAELWLVGPVTVDVRQLIPELPGLRIVGPVAHTEVANILRQCDVMVFPSYFEGFGLVVLEAMACGLPVIASDATIAPDVYTDGEGGWIIPAGNIEALTAKLEARLNDPNEARNMRREARSIAEQHTWAAYGDRWADTLDFFKAG